MVAAIASAPSWSVWAWLIRVHNKFLKEIDVRVPNESIALGQSSRRKLPGACSIPNHLMGPFMALWSIVVICWGFVEVVTVFGIVFLFVFVFILEFVFKFPFHFVFYNFVF